MRSLRYGFFFLLLGSFIIIVEMRKEVILLGFLVSCKILISIESLPFLMSIFLVLREILGLLGFLRISRVDWIDHIRQGFWLIRGLRFLLNLWYFSCIFLYLRSLFIGKIVHQQLTVLWVLLLALILILSDWSPFQLFWRFLLWSRWWRSYLWSRFWRCSYSNGFFLVLLFLWRLSEVLEKLGWGLWLFWRLRLNRLLLSWDRMRYLSRRNDFLMFRWRRSHNFANFNIFLFKFCYLLDVFHSQSFFLFPPKIQIPFFLTLNTTFLLNSAILASFSTLINIRFRFITSTMKQSIFFLLK